MIKQLVINNRKSYDDFGVYISKRTISTPKKKVIKETLPFSNIVYDFSNINGEIYWEERSLEYEFDIAEYSTEEMENIKSNLLNWLLNVHDTDIYDPYIPDYHFHGSYDSDSWSEDFGGGTLKVSFKVYPYMIKNNDSNIKISIGNETSNVLENCVDSNISSLTFNGRSVQDDIPNIENPQEIKNVEINKFISSGKNLLNVDSNFTFKYQEINIELKAGTYTISCGDVIKIGKDNVNCFFMNTNNEAFKGFIFTSNKKETIFLEENVAKIRFYSNGDYTTSMEGSSVVKNLQIEKGSTATSYEAYKEPIEIEVDSIILRGIPNSVRDTFKDGIITRRVGVITLDGSETWQTLGGNTRYTAIENVSNDSNIIMCDKLETYIYDVGYMLNQICLKDGKLYVLNNDYTSIEEWSEYLFYNPITVYYSLATPTTENISISEIPTRSKTTVISTDSEIEPIWVAIHYKEKNDVVLNNESSHRRPLTIIVDGEFEMKYKNDSYVLKDGTFENTIYIDTGENSLIFTGQGFITLVYREERF